MYPSTQRHRDRNSLQDMVALRDRLSRVEALLPGSATTSVDGAKRGSDLHAFTNMPAPPNGSMGQQRAGEDCLPELSLPDTQVINAAVSNSRLYAAGLGTEHSLEFSGPVPGLTECPGTQPTICLQNADSFMRESPTPPPSEFSSVGDDDGSNAIPPEQEVLSNPDCSTRRSVLTRAVKV